MNRDKVIKIALKVFINPEITFDKNVSFSFDQKMI